MTDLISIGSSSIRNSQMALSVVSNNIANVNTEGYVRQDLALQEGLPTKNGLFFLGSGAIADGIRRAYDGQIESSLRVSISDLNAQTPLIENTERLINVFGNKNASLTSALGGFFDSLRALSVDASSEVLRNQTINDGQTLAARFNGLAGQLDALDLETRQLATDKINAFNALAEQLASINTNLAKASDVAKQPAALLDGRDQVLRDMAQITRISVSELANGTVSVGIGTNITNATVVDGQKSVPIGISYLDGVPSKSVIQLDPYAEPTNLSGLIGGELGGVLAFRDQMLGPAMTQLDDIASTFISEINAAHAKGMDLTEKAGQPLFTSQPDFSVDYSMAKGNSTVSVAVSEKSSANLRPLTMTYDQQNSRWVVEDTLSGARTTSFGSPAQIAVNGLSITIGGSATVGDVIKVAGELRPARTIAMAISDPKALAAGDLFRVSQSVANTGDATAAIRLIDSAAASGTIPALDTLLVNNVNNDAAVSVSTSYSLAKMILPAGTAELELSMSKGVNSDAQLQVFTRDGRHLFGSALTSAQRGVMLSEQNGFVAGSTYSDTYLNGATAYRGETWSMGSHAKAVITTGDDGSAVVTAEALLNGKALPALTNTGATTMTVVAAGALKLDGSALPALELAAGASLTSSAVVNWLNGAISSAGLSLNATADNEIRIPVNEISTASSSLTLNGVSIHSATAIQSTTELVNNINAQSSTTRVEARLDFDGALILSNAQGYEGQTISLGTGSTVFSNLSGDIQAGINITATRSSGDISERSVALTLSETGSATDLAKLGFATTLQAPKALSEDLVVFTTGSLGNTAALSASYTKAATDPLQLRTSTLEVTFTSDSVYQIRDTQDATVLAQRTYVPGQPIAYQNLQVALTGTPKSGDVFTIDNNRDGFGSNDNLLRLIEVESAKVLGNDETLHDAYLGLLNQAGSTARQAQVTQEALQVVYEQANEARDQVAGVNLDEEAANLIRFQQSYQASARLLQTANQLFDAILRL
ncbi:MAG: flagellar hook-associated protein FlgK [Gammaproteobacteria bacterium]|nr:flagellar hook-associated protein FlgK [Gammaproteobacteria bacterium]